jgi:uncharacterized protein
MKFQPDQLAGVNTVFRYGPGQLVVGSSSAAPAAHAGSVLVPWRGEVLAWAPGAFEDLRAEHFAQLLALAPELVIIGTGARLRFPPPALLRPLIEARIGYESMDTAAAVRTFNVLATEGRSVLGAFVVPAAQAAG